MDFFIIVDKSEYDAAESIRIGMRELKDIHADILISNPVNPLIMKIVVQTDGSLNAMIQKKKQLAELTVSTGENWIGNLSNRELRDIFQPGKE